MISIKHETAYQIQTEINNSKWGPTHKDIFVHEAGKAEVFWQQVIEGVDCNSATCKSEPLHVASLRPTQSQYTSLRQHVQRQRVDALQYNLAEHKFNSHNSYSNIECICVSLW